MVVLVDYKNLIGRSKVMRSVSLVGDVEHDSSMRDACLSIVSSPRSKMVVFCLDGFPKFRYDLLPSYKEGRKREEPELPRYPVQSLLRDLQDAGKLYNTQVALAMSPFMEADDVIASISRGVCENTLQDIHADESLSWWANLGTWKKLYLNAPKFCIMSSDSDLWQLLSDNPSRTVMRVEKMSLVDATTSLPASWVKRGVLTPGELLSWKLTEGDSGDRIPRSRVVPPRKCGSLIWKTLNSFEKIERFIDSPINFPDIKDMVDIDLFKRNFHMTALHERAYPLRTPFFLRLC